MRKVALFQSTIFACFLILLVGAVSKAEGRLTKDDIELCKFQLEQVIREAQALGSLSNEMKRLAAGGNSEDVDKAFTRVSEQALKLKTEKSRLFEYCKIE